MAEWIKVAGDNLPEDGSTVLCFWPSLLDGHDEIATAVFENWMWMNPDNEDDEYAEPSHWMPLPSPPQQEPKP